MLVEEVKTVVGLESAKGHHYQDFKNLVNELLDKGLVTGSNQSEGLVEITKLNQQRAKKWDKIVKLNEELTGLIQSLPAQKWIVLSEGWCGDGAQNIPVIAKLAALNHNIDFKIYLRDDNPSLMDQFLSNGSRSIPKLIIADAKDLSVKAEWGSRPAPLMELLKAYKADDTISKDMFNHDVHAWYAKDKGQTIQKELLALISAI